MEPQGASQWDEAESWRFATKAHGLSNHIELEPLVAGTVEIVLDHTVASGCVIRVFKPDGTVVECAGGAPPSRMMQLEAALSKATRASAIEELSAIAGHWTTTDDGCYTATLMVDNQLHALLCKPIVKRRPRQVAGAIYVLAPTELDPVARDRLTMLAVGVAFAGEWSLRPIVLRPRPHHMFDFRRRKLEW